MVSISPADRSIVREEKIKPFDRRGEVLWADNFESGIRHWGRTLFGTGSSVGWSATRARNGGFSCKITPGDSVGDYAYINHHHTLPALSRFGLEVSFTYTTSVSDLYWYFHLYPVTRLRAVIHYESSTEKLYYEDKDGVEQELASGVGLSAQGTLFHTIKLVVDPSFKYYTRLLLDSNAYDLSPYPLRDTATSEDPCSETIIYVVNGVSGAHPVYVDDVILTENEP